MIEQYREPEFTAAVRGEICAEVMERAQDAVGALRQRDSDFTTWDMQAERDPWWSGVQPRWQGGSFLEDPMTDEHLFETEGSICYIQRQSEWYQVSETKSGEAQEAADLEAFLNDLVVETKLNTKYLYDLVCMSGRHSYGVLHVGWEQKYEKQYTPMWRHKRSDRLVEWNDPEVALHPEDYKETEQINETVLNDGIVLRVPYTGDIYLDNPGAQSFQGAARVIERFMYTEDDLINGIEDYGFDEKRVKEILAADRSIVSDCFWTQYNDRDGVDAGKGIYEVWMVTGTPPARVGESERELMADKRRRDYQWMLCPGMDICFKFSKSQYNRRGYVKYPFRGVPNRMVGHSVCNMLGALQRESSFSLRFGIDFRDLYMSSPMIMPDELYQAWDNFKSFPGAAFPIPREFTAAQIQPLPYNPAGFTASQAGHQMTLSRAGQYFSSDVRGPAEVANRSATEASQMASGADEKLDLLLMNFHMGVEDTADVILSHYAQFRGDEGDTRMIGQREVKISPEMLRKKFRISASGTSENASPHVKLSRAMALANFARQDPILQQKFVSGDKTGAYFVASHVYRALGIRNPQAIIGREPIAPPNSEYILEAVMGVAQQLAQQGDPGAAAIMQMSQQLIEQGQQQAEQGGGAPQEPQQKVSVSANFKDMPQEAQVGLLNMIGLPAGQPSQQQPAMAGRNGVH